MLPDGQTPVVKSTVLAELCDPKADEKVISAALVTKMAKNCDWRTFPSTLMYSNERQRAPFQNIGLKISVPRTALRTPTQNSVRGVILHREMCQDSAAEKFLRIDPVISDSNLPSLPFTWNEESRHLSR